MATEHEPDVQGRFEVGDADVQPKVRVERWARAHTDLFAIR
jgi:hypothetical protein